VSYHIYLQLETILESTFTTHTHTAIEHILWVNSLLDLEEASVVGTEERILPLLLIPCLVVIRGCPKDLSHVRDKCIRGGILGCGGSAPCAEINDVNEGEGVTPGGVHGGGIGGNVFGHTANVVLPDERDGRRKADEVVLDALQSSLAVDEILRDYAAEILDVDADDRAWLRCGPVDRLISIVPRRLPSILVGFESRVAPIDAKKRFVGGKCGIGTLHFLVGLILDDGGNRD
jgi:hypothetical protein